MKQRIKSLELQVRQLKEENEGLEDTIKDKNSILKAIGIILFLGAVVTGIALYR